jgi:hypothetical protein
VFDFGSITMILFQLILVKASQEKKIKIAF